MIPQRNSRLLPASRRTVSKSVWSSASIATIKDLVPQEHFLRKRETVLDLSFVYAETENLYSRKNGHPQGLSGRPPREQYVMTTGHMRQRRHGYSPAIQMDQVELRTEIMLGKR